MKPDLTRKNKPSEDSVDRSSPHSRIWEGADDKPLDQSLDNKPLRVQFDSPSTLDCSVLLGARFIKIQM